MNLKFGLSHFKIYKLCCSLNAKRVVTAVPPIRTARSTQQRPLSTVFVAFFFLSFSVFTSNANEMQNAKRKIRKRDQQKSKQDNPKKKRDDNAGVSFLATNRTCLEGLGMSTKEKRAPPPPSLNSFVPRQTSPRASSSGYQTPRRTASSSGSAAGPRAA